MFPSATSRPKARSSRRRRSIRPWSTPTASTATAGRRASSCRRPTRFAAIKGPGRATRPVKANDVVVLIGAGPLGTGMEETYQLTSALKYLPVGQDRRGRHRRALLRRVDRRLHRPRRPGSAGRRPDRQARRRRRRRDRDRSRARSRVASNLVAVDGQRARCRSGAPRCSRRARRTPASAPHAKLPADTRLWAALQQAERRHLGRLRLRRRRDHRRHQRRREGAGRGEPIMITRRDIAVAVVAAGITAAAVAAQPTSALRAMVGKQAPAILQSTTFDWTTMAEKKTDVGSVRQVVRAPTVTLDELEMHVTTLNPGQTSHAPHQHPNEELIIIKEAPSRSSTSASGNASAWDRSCSTRRISCTPSATSAPDRRRITSSIGNRRDRAPGSRAFLDCLSRRRVSYYRRARRSPRPEHGRPIAAPGSEPRNRLHPVADSD